MQAEKILCAVCGRERHDASYRQCYKCHTKSNGAASYPKLAHTPVEKVDGRQPNTASLSPSNPAPNDGGKLARYERLQHELADTTRAMLADLDRRVRKLEGRD